MRVTVCELGDEPDALASEWEGLIEHVRANTSELVLLPELPFSPWFGHSSRFDAERWEAAVEAHGRWIQRLPELAPATVLGTRPVNAGPGRYNEAFVWRVESGALATHRKYLLPDEPGFFEASWYGRGDGPPDPLRCGAALVGIQICTELWHIDQARRFGLAGAHLIATPRATPAASLQQWIAAAQTVALVAGTFSLSSNHAGRDESGTDFGGGGWVVSPSGDLLALTSREQPFATVEIDVRAADAAKRQYPHYVLAELPP